MHKEGVHEMKAVFIAFFDYFGLIMEEYVLSGQTVNAIYCREDMCKLHKQIRKKYPEL